MNSVAYSMARIISIFSIHVNPLPKQTENWLLCKFWYMYCSFLLKLKKYVLQQHKFSSVIYSAMKWKTISILRWASFFRIYLKFLSLFQILLLVQWRVARDFGSDQKPARCTATSQEVLWRHCQTRVRRPAVSGPRRWDISLRQNLFVIHQF